MKGLRAAIGFLTRVPVGRVESDSMGAAINWFAFVGLLIGAASGGVFVGALQLWPPFVAAGLALSFEWLVTGAFHHDGLADMADGFGGGWTPDQRLEIMKDSRHGTYGVVTLVAVMALQIAALASLGTEQGLVALIAANVFGRTGAVVVMATVRPARPDGLGVGYRSGLKRRNAFAGAGVVSVGVATIVGLPVVGLLLAAAVGSAAVAWLSWRKIGGMAGDVLGAVEQIAATGVLLAASALAVRASWPWWV